MDKNVSRLLSLVNQLLDFRRTEIEGFRLNFVRTNLVELLQETTDRFQESAASQGLLLNWTSSAAELYAYVDREAVTKIFSNLLANAIKYARSSIRIHLHLNDREQIEMDFINDGKPIPEELREKIFEPFYRIPNTEGKTGTGLGLPLARSLAEMHHGTLVLDKPGTDGAQTCFRLLLPLQQPESIQPPQEEVPETKTEAVRFSFLEGRPTILVVEDHPEMRTFIAEELNKDYNVCTAENGAHAIEWMHRQSIQLVVSDVMMPVMDGYAAARAIRASGQPRAGTVPIIAMSANAYAEDVKKCLDSGMNAHISKPLFKDVMLRTIARFV